jgi:hypothetical protein
MKLFPDHARAVTDVTRGQVCDDRDDRRDLTAGGPAADALPALKHTVSSPCQRLQTGKDTPHYGHAPDRPSDRDTRQSPQPVQCSALSKSVPRARSAEGGGGAAGVSCCWPRCWTGRARGCAGCCCANPSLSRRVRLTRTFKTLVALSPGNSTPSTPSRPSRGSLTAVGGT